MLYAPVAADTAEIATLFIELGIFVVGLAVLARLAIRFGFSPVPLYLLGGLGIGSLDFVQISAATETFVQTGSEIGVVLLLFMIGLEYSGEEWATGLRSGLLSGVVDLALNFTPGVLFGLLLGWGWIEALLLGAVTHNSSSGVIAKLLSDLNWLGNRETPAVLIVMVMGDLLMALYLPIIVVLMWGDDLTSGVISIAVALATVVFVLLLAVRYGDVMNRFIGGNNETILLTLFGLILLGAGIAQRLQVSTAVGAFLVGIAVSGAVAERANVLISPLRDLFAAIFFLFFGLQTDAGALAAALPLALLLGLLTALTKMASGWFAAGRLGAGTLGRLRAGAALTPRGEFAIVIAGLGASAGMVELLTPLTGAYVLVMALGGSTLVRLVEPVWRWRQARV